MISKAGDLLCQHRDLGCCIQLAKGILHDHAHRAKIISTKVLCNRSTMAIGSVQQGILARQRHPIPWLSHLEGRATRRYFLFQSFLHIRTKDSLPHEAEY